MHLHCAIDFAGAEAPGADGNPSGGPIYDGPDLLEVREPSAPGFDLRVAHIVARCRGLATYRTHLGHLNPSSKRLNTHNVNTIIRGQTTQGNHKKEYLTQI